VEAGIEREPGEQRGRTVEGLRRPVPAVDLDLELADCPDSQHFAQRTAGTDD
jgi:hypothetical protein